jgi:hypothetical protein
MASTTTLQLAAYFRVAAYSIAFFEFVPSFAIAHRLTIAL